MRFDKQLADVSIGGDTFSVYRFKTAGQHHYLLTHNPSNRDGTVTVMTASGHKTSKESIVRDARYLAWMNDGQLQQGVYIIGGLEQRTGGPPQHEFHHEPPQRVQEALSQAGAYNYER